MDTFWFHQLRWRRFLKGSENLVVYLTDTWSTSNMEPYSLIKEIPSVSYRVTYRRCSILVKVKAYVSYNRRSMQPGQMSLPLLLCAHLLQKMVSNHLMNIKCKNRLKQTYIYPMVYRWEMLWKCNLKEANMDSQLPLFLWCWPPMSMDNPSSWGIFRSFECHHHCYCRKSR